MEQELLRSLLLQASQQQQQQQQQHAQGQEAELLQQQQQQLKEQLRASQLQGAQSSQQGEAVVRAALAQVAAQQQQQQYLQQLQQYQQQQQAAAAAEQMQQQLQQMLQQQHSQLAALSGQGSRDGGEAAWDQQQQHHQRSHHRHHGHRGNQGQDMDLQQQQQQQQQPSNPLVGSAIVRGTQAGAGGMQGAPLHRGTPQAAEILPETDGVRYTSSQQLLIGGEWDFTYSLELAKHFGSGSNITVLCVRPSASVSAEEGTSGRAQEVEKLGATIHYGVDMGDLLGMNLGFQQFDAMRWNNPPSKAFPRMWNAECAAGRFLASGPMLLRKGGVAHVVSGINFKEFDFPSIAQGTGMHLRVTERLNNPFTTYDPCKRGNGSHTSTPNIYTFAVSSKKGGMGFPGKGAFAGKGFSGQHFQPYGGRGGGGGWKGRGRGGGR